MTREEALKEIKMWGIEAPRQREVLETLIPELAESEDERIRKDLVGFIEFIHSIACEGRREMAINKCDITMCERFLTYLEKLKDAFENGRQLGIMQEQARQELGWPDEKQKEHQNKSDALGKALGRDLISPKDKDKNLDEIAQDYVDNVKEYNPEPTWDLLQTAVCYGYHYCEQKGSNDMAFHEGYTLGFEDGMEEKEQKPAEWSEEDDQLIGFIFDLLNSLVWRKEWAMDKKECLERLKSLRSHPKSSDNWKPSEMQMAMLMAVLNDPNNAGSESAHLAFESLYNDLKKL